MDESLKQGQLTGGAPGAWVGRARGVVRRAAAARRAEAVAALLLIVTAANLLAAVGRKSITNDETVLIPSGYYHLVAGNFQLVHEHPPLCKLLSALPLLFIQPDEARPEVLAPASTSGERDWAYETSFWQDNRARFETISFWTRVPMIALTLALGLAVFLFARELFGDRAAVLALFLFSVEPTVLAHGRVVQTDVPAAFGFLLVFYALLLYLKRGGTWRRAALVGAAAGVAMIAKFSMLVVAPALFAVFAALLRRERNRRGARAPLAAHACVAAAASLALVNAAYYFHSRPLTEEDARWVAGSFPSSPAAVWAGVRALRHVLPTDFVLGTFWQLWHSREGHAASLLGMYGRHGWWYYFPVAFALKTTLPFLILSLASLAWACHRFVVRRERAFLILLAPFALYTAFVMMSGIDIGVRYYLPAFPFLFVLGGALLDRLIAGARARRAGLAVAALLACWCAAEAARAFPDYTPYMNELARGRPRWYYLSDSNVEWGDDVRGLADYLRARGETRVRAALLGGYATLGFYGVEYADALALGDPSRPDTRYVALGASFLNGSTVPDRAGLSEARRVNFFDAYRRRKPEAVVGGSIYVYKVRE
jgi:4-amino-4-deoxy-L-arabinose transferase-like glycosyltransferase